LDIEPRLRKIRGYKFLKVLRFKLESIVESRLQKRNAETVEIIGVH